MFRTHEGLDPDIARSSTAILNAAHLARCGKIYKALAPYRKQLVAEAAQRGAPVVRHPFLHYPNDPNTHALRYQFLLGPDVMVAPVLDKGADSVEVYFPNGSAWSTCGRASRPARQERGSTCRHRSENPPFSRAKALHRPPDRGTSLVRRCTDAGKPLE